MVHVWNFLKFNVVSSGSIAIQTIGIQLLTNMYGEKYLFVFKVLIIAFIIIPYSYILYNKVIWKDKK
jgi:putative flippase GtrA